MDTHPSPETSQAREGHSNRHSGRGGLFLAHLGRTPSPHFLALKSREEMTENKEEIRSDFTWHSRAQRELPPNHLPGKRSAPSTPLGESGWRISVQKGRGGSRAVSRHPSHMTPQTATPSASACCLLNTDKWGWGGESDIREAPFEAAPS